jgi:RNA polymerase sigma-70 factor (ECF subfamily)
MDIDLVIRAQGGDREAFASLVLAVGGKLQGLATRVLRDADRAEDVTQTALLSIWRDLPTLRDPERFEAWSYRLVIRACYAEAKRSRRGPDIRFLAVDGSTGGGLGVVDDRDQLDRGFRQLPIDQRAVVVLYHYLDLSIEEVASTLGIPAGTVRSRLHRATRGLRAALDADARPTLGEVAR